MAIKEKLEKKVDREVLNFIDSVIKSSPNPELAKVILFTAYVDRKIYLESGCQMLQVCKEDFDKVLSHLKNSEIVSIMQEERDTEGRFRKAVNDSSVENYLRSELPYGKHEIIKDICLDESKTLKVMNSVKDLVQFNYSRTFKFEDLTKLRNLRKQIHRDLKTTRRIEAEYWHKVLGVPEQFSGFPSFVEENNPTKSEGYEVNDFHLIGKFNSPEEAFKIGFDKALGYPIASKAYQIEGRQEDKFTCAIKISKVGNKNYSFSLNNILWDVCIYYSHSPFAYREEAVQLMPKIQQRLEEVLES